ncbi:MAG: TolC family protein [Polyangiaceae bacterium]
MKRSPWTCLAVPTAAITLTLASIVHAAPTTVPAPAVPPPSPTVPVATLANPPPSPPPRPEGTLQLADAVRLAMSRNERAKIAEFQADVADAAVERARTAFFPTLVTSANDTIKPNEPTRAGASAPPNQIGGWNTTLAQPLLNASAWPLLRQAQRLFDAQRATSDDAKRILEFDAANAFFTALSQEEALEAAQRRVDLAKANLADTQAQVDAQLASVNDATRASVDLASAQQQLETTIGQVNRAYFALGFLMNEPVTGPLSQPTATLQAAIVPVNNAETLVGIAEQKRLDLIASKHSARAAELFASEPMLRLIPTVGISANLTGTTNTDVTGRWNDESVVATATWTVFDAGVRYADKHSRDASASIAALQLDTLVRSVANDVRTASALLAASQAALRSAEGGVTAARQSVDETEILYKQGLAKAIELVDANNSRFLAETSYAAAQFAVAEAYLALRQAMGLEPIGTELR